jgi:hypothetical protein
MVFGRMIQKDRHRKQNRTRHFRSAQTFYPMIKRGTREPPTRRIPRLVATLRVLAVVTTWFATYLVIGLVAHPVAQAIQFRNCPRLDDNRRLCSEPRTGDAIAVVGERELNVTSKPKAGAAQ